MRKLEESAISWNNKTYLYPYLVFFEPTCMKVEWKGELSPPNAFGMGPTPEGVGITALTDNVT